MSEEHSVRRGSRAIEPIARRARGFDRSAHPKNLALVKPVLNCVNILRYLSQSEYPATLTQITQKLDINPSTGLSIIRTLVSLGLVAPHPNTKAYVIGAGVIPLAEGALGRGGILEIFRYPMERLARRHSVTVTLWRMVDEDRMHLTASAVGDGPVQIQMRLGQRLPRWVGAVGYMMAAYSSLSEAELRKKFNGLRWQSPPSFSAYVEQTRQAKRRGYAIDNGNYASGVLSVAAPVFDLSGEITMACGATMFLGQHPPATVAEIAEDLVTIGGLLRPDAGKRRRTGAGVKGR